MDDNVRPVSAFGPDGCTLAFARGGDKEFGFVADTIDTGNGEVYRIEWPDGSSTLWFQPRT